MTAAKGKNIPIESLNALRKQAVELRLAGLKLTEVAARTGLSVPTVIAAYKAFVAGGWQAVPVAPRGRSTGDGRALDTELEARLRERLCHGSPEAAGLDAPLWQEAIAAQWLQRAGVEMGARTLARYLDRWGFDVQLPAERVRESEHPELRAWRRNVYPGLLARARADGAELLWGGETALIDADGARLSLHYAQSGRGRLRWLVYGTSPTTASLIDFFDRLVREAGRKVVLITDGLRTERIPEVQRWLAEQASRIEIHPLPSTLRLPATPERVAPAPFHPDPVPAATGRTPTSPRQASDGERKPMTTTLTHLQRLEAESIHIMREVVAESENPVMLYSIGKDSAVMLHLAMKAFYPAVPPFPLLHVDTTWKFRDMYAFRDMMAAKLGMDLLVHINPEGVEMGINPFTHGSAIHTDIMKTQGLKQALDKYGFDAAFGGARRDEEKSRAKERIFSFRTAAHRWDPKSQRPELWQLYNARKHKGESIRVFPLSNWTELDIWQYIYLESIPIVPLYYAATRPVVERDGTLIMVDDERMPLKPGEVPMMRKVRFRTLGCYPLTGAIESEADTLTAIIQEMLLARTSERQGRVIDHDSAASMEKKKQEGYF